ncbi:MAG: InlB B-repeat-containing protein [Corallococcus sp.]|nr:InlB B-repeat-containing protein [Corallococcus sp.]MCM1358935.1 InlB B-repeat-containing protein [Corallococcus sp.]MCM1394923.1 InlB B-repeat-containing protein [Corallococcus sp.]
MKKRIVIVLATVLICAFALAVCVSCNTGGKYTVTFDPQNGQTPTVVKFDGKFRIPQDPVWDLWKFDGWYKDADCMEKWSVPDNLTEDITVYAKWTFLHDFGDEYLLWDTECLDDGCTVLGRNPSTNQAKERFVYNFNESKKADVDAAYNAVTANIANGNDYAGFENLYEIYDDNLNYVVEQYQIAYVLYCTYTDAKYETNYNYVTECYNDNVSRYYKLFRDIYNSNYRNNFFEGWSNDQINQALTLSDSYGNSQYTEIKNRIDALTLEYNNLMDSNASASQISAKYGELVALNNDLASLAGYDGYMDYAYGNVYGRSYSPADVTAMRNYVKTYIAPKLDELAAYFDSFLGFYSYASRDYYLDIATESVFFPNEASKQNVNLMGKYFQNMTNPASANGKEINFYKVANDVFKNGNYYLGQQDGAYTYYIGAQNSSVMYFSNQKNAYGYYTYQNTFTFVHEFGHYFNGYYNGGLDVSMDHDETQSQGNEMLFLAWLADNVPKGCAQGYEALSKEKLVGMLTTICIATAVDEFEQAAYEGIYEGQPVGASNYNDVFEQILDDYGSTLSDYGDYWTYVVFEQPAYYISYAMSALPCVELFVNARQDFAAAKQSYFKLFTFSDDETFVSPDGEVLKTYAEILAYCGLNDPFDEQLYTTIYDNLT